MSEIPACPLCAMENTYPDGANYVCADCGHEWPIVAAAETEGVTMVVRDVNGNTLAGDGSPPATSSGLSGGSNGPRIRAPPDCARADPGGAAGCAEPRGSADSAGSWLPGGWSPRIAAISAS